MSANTENEKNTSSSTDDLPTSSTSKNELTWSNVLPCIAQQASVYGIAFGYCISASLLSIINKWAIMKFPYPGAQTALQYFTSIGLAISFFGFSCRRAISATGFTVLGIVNKLLTVVINLVIWDKHSTLVGTAKPRATVVDAKPPTDEGEHQQLLEIQPVAEGDEVGLGETK